MGKWSGRRGGRGPDVDPESRFAARSPFCHNDGYWPAVAKFLLSLPVGHGGHDQGEPTRALQRYFACALLGATRPAAAGMEVAMGGTGRPAARC